MIVLVCGLSGSGKTTLARELIGDGIAYDLDAIAGAFRLREPHEEYHAVARRMANDMLRAFCEYTRQEDIDCIVIRTAPTIEELKDIDPDKVMVTTGNYVQREMDDREGASKRIENVITYAHNCEIPVEIIPPMYI